jgi:3-phenylpropionate/trans-cinnamate dioxygenase ferredoxin subunit
MMFIVSIVIMLISHDVSVIMEIMAFVKVAKAADVAPGTIKGFVVGDKKVAMANANGKLYAFEDKCPHLGAKLSTGLVLGNVVMCKVHGEQFDLTTGKPIIMLSKEPLRMYPVKVEGDDILADI